MGTCRDILSGIDISLAHQTSDMDLLADGIADFIETPLISGLSGKVVLQNLNGLRVLTAKRVQSEDVRPE